MSPLGKRPKAVTKVAVRNLLEELAEYLGAVLLPSEQISYDQMHNN